MSDNDNDMVQIENHEGEIQEIEVEQLLNFDLSNVEEIRGFQIIPEGIFEFRVVGLSNKKVPWTTKQGEDRKSMVLDCELEVIACRQCKDSEIDPATLTGTSHTEGFFLSQADDLGKIAAFFADIGVKGKGTILQLCDRAIGLEFVAPIYHKKNKNDTSKVFANLDKDAIETLSIPAQVVGGNSGIQPAAPQPDDQQAKVKTTGLVL